MWVFGPETVAQRALPIKQSNVKLLRLKKVFEICG